MVQRYRCGICKKRVDVDVSIVGLQCDRCGGKVFYKERPNKKMVIKAR